MTDQEIPSRSWSIDDQDTDRWISPLEFLVGHVRRRWVGDNDSLFEAITTIFSATFVQAGIDPDEAVDIAMQQAERVKAIELKEDGIEFVMEDEEE